MFQHPTGSAGAPLSLPMRLAIAARGDVRGHAPAARLPAPFPQAVQELRPPPVPPRLTFPPVIPPAAPTQRTGPPR